LKNIVIKLSGDLKDNDGALQFIKEKAKTNYVVVIVGGGTYISQELESLGYKTEFKNGIRIHPDINSRKIARNILEDIETDLQNKLLNTHVVTPYLYIGRMLCHINADHFFELLAPSFDECYCLTLKGRSKKMPPEIKIVYL